MTDDDLRALQEQSHLMEEMTRHPGWPVYVDFIRELMVGQQRSVINGHMDSFERYKAVTGQLVGLQKAIDAPQTVAQMVDTELVRRKAAGE